MSQRTETLDSRAIAATVLLGCALATGCVRFSTEVTYFLVSSNGLATLEFGVSKPGVCVNIHGGCADVYQFEFPANLSVVSADAILSYRVNYLDPAPSEKPEAGQITVTIAPSGCEVSVNLFSKARKPLPVNGNFKQLRCGQNS